jgi:hypothetical protein
MHTEPNRVIDEPQSVMQVIPVTVAKHVLEYAALAGSLARPKTARA